MSDKPYLIDPTSLRPEQLQDLEKAARSELVQSMQPYLRELYKDAIVQRGKVKPDARTKAFFENLDYSGGSDNFKY